MLHVTVWVLAVCHGLMVPHGPKSIPTHVEVLPDGCAVLRVRDAVPHEALPTSVPVLTKGPDGSVHSGVLLRNWSDRPVPFLEVQQPSRVVVTGEGPFELETWTVSPTWCGGWREGIPPGTSIQIPFSEVVQVVHEAEGPPPPPDRGNWSLQIAGDVTTFPPNDVQAIAQATTRIAGAVTPIFRRSTGMARVAIVFADLGGANGPRAVTGPLTTATSLNTVRMNLTTRLDDPESPAENAIYAQLPPAATVNVVFANGQVTQVSSIEVVSALATHWGQPQPAQPDAFIAINRARMWDYNVRNGVDAGKEPFERSLYHECMHALGFRCLLESETDNRITVWDLFRISRADLMDDGAQAGEFRNSSRMLQPGVEAYGVTLLGAGNSYRVSTGIPQQGGDYESPHWKHETVDQPYIGLMDPDSTRVTTNLIEVPDLRAMDIIGWDLHLGEPPVAPEPPAPEAPPDQQSGTSLSPQFLWFMGSGSDVSDLYVFRGIVVNSAAEVISAPDLVVDTYTPGPDTLRPGTVYLWFVTAVNAVGFAYSEQRTFTTAGCSADWDRSGAVNSSDTSAFLTSWLADTNNGRLESDFNYDGATNSTDISAFLTAWLEQASLDCGL